MKSWKTRYGDARLAGIARPPTSYGPPPEFGEICPAGAEFGFEGMMASKGRIAFARGILDGQLEWTDSFLDAIYKCTVCGGCQNQCELDHKPFIPEIIEAMRRKAVKDGVGPMPTQKKISPVSRLLQQSVPGSQKGAHRLDPTFQKSQEAH